MAHRIRLWLWSTKVEDLRKVENQIREIALKTGTPMKGPIPLPTKILQVPIFRLPHGEGSKYWDKYELRIHKRLIELLADERVLRRLMRIQIPDSVHIEIKQMRE